MRAPIPVLLAAAALLAGCGGSDHAATAPPVRLAVSAPQDLSTVRAASVTVSGTVRPAGATVTVRGRRADVTAGRFSARVDVDPGVNVIDVLASAGRARPAMTALRVRRVTTVTLPDVTGSTPGDARSQLEGLGVKVDTKRTGGFFDELLGGDRVVCDTDPTPGSDVDLGSTVTLLVGRNC